MNFLLSSAWESFAIFIVMITVTNIFSICLLYSDILFQLQDRQLQHNESQDRQKTGKRTGRGKDRRINHCSGENNNDNIIFKITIYFYLHINYNSLKYNERLTLVYQEALNVFYNKGQRHTCTNQLR